MVCNVTYLSASERHARFQCLPSSARARFWRISPSRSSTELSVDSLKPAVVQPGSARSALSSPAGEQAQAIGRLRRGARRSRTNPLGKWGSHSGRADSVNGAARSSGGDDAYPRRCIGKVCRSAFVCASQRTARGLLARDLTGRGRSSVSRFDERKRGSGE